MIGRPRALYEATYCGRKFRGTRREIAEHFGKNLSFIKRRSDEAGNHKGKWTFRRIGERKNEYTATKEGDDPIIGSAAEVACLIGRTDTYVCYLAKTGKKSSDGWSVTRRVVEE